MTHKQFVEEAYNKIDFRIGFTDEKGMLEQLFEIFAKGFEAGREYEKEWQKYDCF